MCLPPKNNNNNKNTKTHTHNEKEKVQKKIQLICTLIIGKIYKATYLLVLRIVVSTIYALQMEVMCALFNSILVHLYRLLAF